MVRTTRLNVADVAAIAFVVVLLVPQSTVLGRAQLAIGCFLLWFGLSFRASSSTFAASVPLLLLLVCQSLVYVLKSLAADSFDFFQQSLVGFATIALSLIVCSHYLLTDPDKWRVMKGWALIGVAVCVLPAIPVVLRNPGVMRLLVSQSQNEVDLTEFRWQGVPGYPLVYTVSMCIFVYLQLAGQVTGLQRYLVYAAVSVFVVHVLLSTLALPIALLVVVSICWVVYSILRQPAKAFRVVSFCGIVILVFNLLAGGALFDKFFGLVQVDRVVSKVEDLFYGISEKGFVEGDETSRGERIVETFETFLNNPLFGRSFSDRADGRIGGHSSIVDPLAMFGLIGYIPMWAFYWLLIRNSIRERSGTGRWRSSEVFAWCFFGVASFWNSTTFTVLPYAILFLSVADLSRKDRSGWLRFRGFNAIVPKRDVDVITPPLCPVRQR